MHAICVFFRPCQLKKKRYLMSKTLFYFYSGSLLYERNSTSIKMALNCPVSQPMTQFGSNETKIFPLPFQGEYICAGRDHCSFKIDGPHPFK